MALSRRSSRTGRSRFTLLLLVLTSITVLTLDFRGSGIVDDLRGGASTAFGPLRDAGAWVGEPVADAWNGIFDYGDLQEENEALRERLAELEGDQAEAEDALRQLDELAELERVSRWTALPTVVTRVVGGSLSNFQHTVELDKGSDDGLAEGMPVVTGAGLVGRLTQVTGSRSVAQLITDPSFTFGVRLARSGEVGFVHGRGPEQPLVIDAGIEVATDVREREALTTAGTDRSIFPSDIPVGRVLSVDVAPDQLSQVIDVRPLADLDNLAYVRVVQWTPPT